MKTTAKQISTELRAQSNPAIAAHSQRFFKTGKGEYGYGDKFLGIRVPVLRKTARQFRNTDLDEVEVLLKSAFHEERLCALFLLVNQFNRADQPGQKTIYDLYLNHTAYINNWDLVDSSAYKIVGPYLEDKNKQILFKLSASDNLWERRIAIMSSLHFIKKHQFNPTLELSKRLINDDQDLIHKAVGWMLREIGKRDEAVEKAFLKSHYKSMPRTMLRYAIEKFPQAQRKQYLSGQI